MTKKKVSKAKKSVRTLRTKTLDEKQAGRLRGGGKRHPQTAGSLDAGIHFKYDLKAQKEA